MEGPLRTVRRKVEVSAKSRDYLRRIQSRVYERLGVELEDLEAVSKVQIQGLERGLSEGRVPIALPGVPESTAALEAAALLDKIRDLELLTPYENRLQYAQIVNQMDVIDSAAGKFRANVEDKEVDIRELLGFTLNRPAIGTLPTGRLYPTRVGSRAQTNL